MYTVYLDGGDFSWNNVVFDNKADAIAYAEDYNKWFSDNLIDATCYVED